MSKINFKAPTWSARILSKPAARMEKAAINSELKFSYGLLTGPTGTTLDHVKIEISGDLARIPGLKNNRNPRFPGIDPMVRARLKALDSLFEVEAIRLNGINFGNEQVFMIVSFATQTRSFDEDNALTTLKDWLEPKTKLVGAKNKSKRGWGIGLVQNDAQVVAIGFKASDCGRDGSLTEIVIHRYRTIAADLREFTSKVFDFYKGIK